MNLIQLFYFGVMAWHHIEYDLFCNWPKPGYLVSRVGSAGLSTTILGFSIISLARALSFYNLIQARPGLSIKTATQNVTQSGLVLG